MAKTRHSNNPLFRTSERQVNIDSTQVAAPDRIPAMQARSKATSSIISTAGNVARIGAQAYKEDQLKEEALRRKYLVNRAQTIKSNFQNKLNSLKDVSKIDDALNQANKELGGMLTAKNAAGDQLIRGEDDRMWYRNDLNPNAKLSFKRLAENRKASIRMAERNAEVKTIENSIRNNVTHPDHVQGAITELKDLYINDGYSEKEAGRRAEEQRAQLVSQGFKIDMDSRIDPLKYQEYTPEQITEQVDLLVNDVRTMDGLSDKQKVELEQSVIARGELVKSRSEDFIRANATRQQLLAAKEKSREETLIKEGLKAKLTAETGKLYKSMNAIINKPYDERMKSKSDLLSMVDGIPDDIISQKERLALNNRVVQFCGGVDAPDKKTPPHIKRSVSLMLADPYISEGKKIVNLKKIIKSNKLDIDDEIKYSNMLNRTIPENDKRVKDIVFTDMLKKVYASSDITTDTQMKGEDAKLLSAQLNTIIDDWIGEMNDNGKPVTVDNMSVMFRKRITDIASKYEEEEYEKFFAQRAAISEHRISARNVKRDILGELVEKDFQRRTGQDGR